MGIQSSWILNGWRSPKNVALLILFASALAIAVGGVAAFKIFDHGSHAEHAEEDKHEQGEEQKSIQLSTEAIKLAGIEVEPAKSGTVKSELEATGEITLNGDTLTHVKPYVAGVVKEVFKSIGDKVGEGEPLAIILSPDLGKAKIDYFSAKQTLDLAQVDFDREKKVYENTLALLELLKANPEMSELEKAHIGAIGENKSKLLSAYAAFKLSKSSLDRAMKLREKNIMSQENAEKAVKENDSAQAEYKGTYEEIEFNCKTNYVKATRALQVAETSYRNARRYLHILGMAEAEIDKLALEKDADVAIYVLKAPRGGAITEKHISQGEKILDDVDYPDSFVIADLSTVWLDINIYISNLDQVKAGQEVSVEMPGHKEVHSGRILRINPTIAEKTRTATARVVLNNADGKLHPGLFVTAQIALSEVKAPVVAPLEAIQSVDGKAAVFIAQDGKFSVKQVLLGMKDSNSYEVKEGLLAGTPIVVKNAFSIRTELDKAKFEAD